MKIQEIPLRISPVKIHLMTSYDGIIRIRLKGRSSITSSQPANELPCFYQICNVSLLNHRQTYYSASGGIFKCDFLVHFYPLHFYPLSFRVTVLAYGSGSHLSFFHPPRPLTLWS